MMHPEDQRICCFQRKQPPPHPSYFSILPLVELFVYKFQWYCLVIIILFSEQQTKLLLKLLRSIATIMTLFLSYKLSNTVKWDVIRGLPCFSELERLLFKLESQKFKAWKWNLWWKCVDWNQPASFSSRLGGGVYSIFICRDFGAGSGRVLVKFFLACFIEMRLLFFL